jgi:hypothetical protein
MPLHVEQRPLHVVAGMGAIVTFLLPAICLQVHGAFCLGVADHWEAGDDPSTERWRHFPNCLPHLNLPVGNIALGQPDGTAR